MSSISYNKSDIPVTYEADVLVAGGGLGGIAAALSAARSGAKTVLIERNTYLGGVATAGMCCSVYNCLCTDSGEIAVSGIPFEVVETLANHAGGPGESWKKHRGHIIYDIEQAKLVFEKLLVDAGVTVLTGMMVCDTIIENRSVKGIIAAGRNGLEAILAKNIVDSTGDCSVAYFAGAPMEYALKKQSYVFRMGNVDLDAFVNYFRENPSQYPSKMDVNWSIEDALRQYDENGTFLFPHGGGFQNEIVKNAVENGILKDALGSHNHLCAMQMHGIKSLGVLHLITGYTDLESLNAAEIERAVLDGRIMANHIMSFFKKCMPGFENAFICAGADDLGIRNSRRVKTTMEFTREMKENVIPVEDVIGKGVVEKFKVLNEGKDAWSAQVLSDDLFEIPLRCLIPQNIKGVIMGAGRSVSGLLRVMVVTMIVGQAAGAAAAIASANNITVDNVDYKEVQNMLKKSGVNSL